LSGASPQCVCDNLWNGAGCTVDMHRCVLQGAVQARRDNVVGACSLTALDKAVAHDACGAPGSEISFTVPDVLAGHHGWKVCALLNAVLDVYNPGDGVQSSHCAGVAPATGPGSGTATPDTVPGPGCTWKASVQHVFGHGTSLGMPVRCRGYGCTPPGAFEGATWAELVPAGGVPTMFDARTACRNAQATATERASLASNRDVDEVQARQLRGARGTSGIQHAVLWYVDDVSSDLAWRIHPFLWVGNQAGTLGSWQEARAPILLGQPAGQYLQPDPADPNAEPHFHSIVCVVSAVYTPGIPRVPSTPLAQGGATALLWLSH
jgi:hypothetical protein